MKKNAKKEIKKEKQNKVRDVTKYANWDTS
jgi:hypothetical protein